MVEIRNKEGGAYTSHMRGIFGIKCDVTVPTHVRII